MTVNYDIPKINQCLQDFYYATGINMDLLKDDFSFVGEHSYWENKRYCKAIQSTKSGHTACRLSDKELLEKSRMSKKPEMHICHAGLMDCAIPILYGDEIIGYILFGQIKTDTDFSKFGGYLSSLGLDEKEMERFYEEISFFKESVITSISNIAEMLVKHILLENMLRPNFDESIQPALNYINENLDSDLSIQKISQNTNISKSALYRRFQSCFGCTVGEYINDKRIEKASGLLKTTDFSIEEVSGLAGFSSGSYFCKIFKRKMGVSPFKFKNINKGI